MALAASVVEDVAWECWTLALGADQLFIWLLDSTDDSDLRPLVSETEHEVVVTLRGPRWQGASLAMALKAEKRIQLAAPLGARHVVDGATGVRRPDGHCAERPSCGHQGCPLSVSARPKAANRSELNVVISAMAPSSTRRTSSLKAR